MIRVEHVSKYFGDRLILDDIQTEFLPGKCNLIIGASGSGKSVLMKCMVGLLNPDQGAVTFDGRDFSKLEYDMKQEVRREIGMLFQGGALFDSLTVEQNVGFPLQMFSKLSKSEQKERVDFCLHKVNLEGKNTLFPSEISGGMKKRVGIARAIALNPKYLFCDEPNSGLDPVTSRVIDKLIEEITYEFGITTIINTHDMKTVFDMGESIIFIYKGKKWWEGTKNNLLSNNNPELQAFLEASRF